MTSYIELHCHSNFSLLEGASSVDALVTKAVEYGMPALALTDHDAVYSAVRFHKATQAHGIRPIFGAELTLLVRNADGWRNLCTLIKLARHAAPKGELPCRQSSLLITRRDLSHYPAAGRGISTLLRQKQYAEARHAAEQYKTLFGADGFFFELQNHLLPGDTVLIQRLTALGEATGLCCAATNNVHYAEQAGHRLEDVLVCIRHNTLLEESEHLCRPNSEYFLKSPEQMRRLFASYPDALATTLHIAEQCDFTLNYGLQTLPTFPSGGQSAHDYLETLCRQGLSEQGMHDSAKVVSQLQHELASSSARGWQTPS